MQSCGKAGGMAQREKGGGISHLAPLSASPALFFYETGGGAATGKEKLWLFFSRCPRLALSLPVKRRKLPNL